MHESGEFMEMQNSRKLIFCFHRQTGSCHCQTLFIAIRAGVDLLNTPSLHASKASLLLTTPPFLAGKQTIGLSVHHAVPVEICGPGHGSGWEGGEFYPGRPRLGVMGVHRPSTRGPVKNHRVECL